MEKHCPVCDGFGEVNFSGRPCEVCGGSGQWVDYCEGENVCVECVGMGVVEVDGVEVDCVKCQGTGEFEGGVK